MYINIKYLFISVSVIKVWGSAGVGKLECYEEGKMGYFSVLGHRTPQVRAVGWNSFFSEIVDR